jgi:major membrane immunogen (membrane-anchored lipoprotein)
MRAKRYIVLGIGIILLGSIFILARDGQYKDGKFRGTSRSVYTREEFYGVSDITIYNGKIEDVKFKIIDSVNHEIFDDNYEKHFIGNQEYIEQCRENWDAMQKFSEELIKSQKIDDFDAVTGATWAGNIFKASVKDALKKAK